MDEFIAGFLVSHVATQVGIVFMVALGLYVQALIWAEVFKELEK